MVSFQQGRLEVSLKPGSPADLPKRLQAFLKEHTKRPWQVIVVPFSEKSGSTLAEQAAERKRLLEEKIKDHPALDTARSFFPGVVIEEVKTLP